MGKDKIEESFILGVLKGFLGKLRWKTSFRELCITWKNFVSYWESWKTLYDFKV